MIHSLRRHLLNRFVLRPSQDPIEYAPKERQLLQLGADVDEYFVRSITPQSSDLPTNLAAAEATDRSGQDDPRSCDLIVLKFPGTAGRAERASDWPGDFLPRRTLRLYAWNAPGYGGSSGKPTLANIASRARRFLDNVCDSLPAPCPRIWLVGNSLGCATATYLASLGDHPIDGLVLRNPPPLIPTFKRVARRYPLGRLTDAIAESLPSEMNLASTAPKVRVPTVMMQSELDRLVPPQLQMQVFDALPCEKHLVVMDGLDHDGIATEEHFDDIQAAINWLWNSSAST